jgi:CHAT domain-containing protein
VIDQLNHALDGLAPDDQPFVAPYYWAGFVYVGA